MLRAISKALCLLLLLPGCALALGFGDIRLRSALNAPLDAEIDITATADELAGVKASLAGRDRFSRAGLEYPSFLASANVQVAKSASGRDILRLRTTEPVTEPFLTVLVQVDYARGQLIREYTVLLDPPVFAAQSATTAVAAPVTAEAARSGSVERANPPAPAPAPAPGAPRPAAAPVAPAVTAPATSRGGTYHVRNGDTLFKIAASQLPNVNRERAQLAIYRRNTGAFDGNLNVLRAGTDLDMPSDTELAAIAPADARAEISRQTRDWTAGSGRLRLVPPQGATPEATPGSAGASQPAATTPAPATGAGNQNLQARVDQLQQQLAETQRLLELRNAELARLQAQAGGTTPLPAPAPTRAPAPTTVAPATPATPPAAPMAATPTPPSAPAGESLTDWVIAHWYVPVLALALILAGLMGLRAYRARQAEDDDQSFDRLSGNAFDQISSSTATLPVRVLPDTAESAIVVEESGTHRGAQPMSGPAAAAAAAEPVQVDTPAVTNTAMALEQGDALAEADFHMAYGLYDQAAELVTQAIAREPQRRDLRLKLLEVFFVWGNKERFVQLAHELAGSRAEALPGEWEKIIIMGRQLAPEDSLFAGDGSVGAVANAGVDLNLEGGQNRVDFDLMGEPLVGRHTDAGVDVDLGAALAANEETAESARAPGDSGVDFVLDDPVRGDDGALRTRELPRVDASQKTAILDLSGNDQEGPTAELPQLEAADRGTIRLKLEGHSGQSGTTGEPTAELALDDLGLDMGTLTSESLSHPGVNEGLDPTGMNSMHSDPGASGSWPVADSGSGGMPAVSTESPTVQVDPGAGATTRSNSLRLDSGDFNLDTGSATSEANTLAATSTRATTISASALPDLEPPTMSEVGTKLDLARAYMDMGDPEGARNILEEVLAEGSASQKQEARRLIDSLPG